jgi:hypothetical protein
MGYADGNRVTRFDKGIEGENMKRKEAIEMELLVKQNTELVLPGIENESPEMRERIEETQKAFDIGYCTALKWVLEAEE